MGLPAGVSTVTVTGKFLDAAGNPRSGHVSFTPSNELTDAAGLVVVTPQPVTVTIGADGSFSSPPLAATDSAALLPAGWSYQVAVTLGTQQDEQFSCFLPSSPSTVDITALVPLTEALPMTSFLTAQGGTLWGPLVLRGTPALRIPSGAISGAVLTSDASGNATWGPPAGFGWFNVRFYGATGNGSTDDTLACQAAFTAAQAAGGCVYFPAGTYKVSSALTYTSSNPLKVYGDGYASYLRTSSATADVLTISGVSGLEIEDIRCGTSAGTPTAGAGLDLIACSTVRIKNFYTSNCWNGMATSGGGAPITILESWIQGKNFGLYLLQNSLHAFSTGFSGGSIGCVLDSTGGAIRFLGCDFYGALSLTTRNSLSIGSPNQGIWIIDGEANYEAGTNPTEGPGGFNLDWAKGEVHVDHCWLSGSGLTFGGSVSSPTSISITGGTFGGASYAMPNPLKISGGTQVSITGATFQGSASTSYDSILIGSAVQATAITGNTFGNSTAQYHVNSASTAGPVVVAGNSFKLASPVNYPSGSASAYTFSGNSSGPVTSTASLPWLPADNGLLIANGDPWLVTNTSALTAGTLYLAKLTMRQALTLTCLWWSVQTGASGTSTGSFTGLYSSAGTLLTGSSDVGTVLTAAGGAKCTLATPQSLSSGSFAWAALLVNMTSQPTLYRGAGVITVTSMNLSVSVARFATNGTGLTALPSTITPSSNGTGSAISLWCGAS